MIVATTSVLTSTIILTIIIGLSAYNVKSIFNWILSWLFVDKNDEEASEEVDVREKVFTLPR